MTFDFDVTLDYHINIAVPTLLSEAIDSVIKSDWCERIRSFTRPPYPKDERIVTMVTMHIALTWTDPACCISAPV